MIDTINPMGFDLTKKLHGHVRIETRDKWTGRIIDSQEKENLVTNALQQLVQAGAMIVARTGNVASYTSLQYLYAPLYMKAFGTLLLFDGALTESVNNITFPSNAKLVAFAGQRSNTSDANSGSYNAAESVVTANGFTTVWDFLTSQANGTIASLGRTSFDFCNRPWWSAYGIALANMPSTASLLTGYTILGYDETNNYLYIAPSSNQTIDGVSYPTTNIYRLVYSFSKIGMYGGVMPPASKLTLVKTLTSSDGSTNANNFRYDKYNNNFFCPVGTTLHIIAIDGTHSTKSISYASATQLAIMCTENYYWAVNNNSTANVYRMSKSNTSDVVQYTRSANGSGVPLENDMLIIGGAGSSGAATLGKINILYPDGTVIPLQLDSNQNPVDNASRVWAGILGIQGAGLFPSTHYLGTIANLDSPVTKTSSQTMKITYTLTES